MSGLGLVQLPVVSQHLGILRRRLLLPCTAWTFDFGYPGRLCLLVAFKVFLSFTSVLSLKESLLAVCMGFPPFGTSRIMSDVSDRSGAFLTIWPISLELAADDFGLVFLYIPIVFVCRLDS